MIKASEPLEICSPAEQSSQTPGVGLMGRRQSDLQAEGGPGLRGRRGRPRGDAAGRIGKVYAFMVQHVDESLQIAALGRMAGLSASSFYQLFKTATGWTPNVFVIRMRMYRACGLLQRSDLRVKEIAARLGYRDQFYFSRVFKSVSAMAPLAYRRLTPPLQRQIQEELDPNRRTAEGGLRRSEGSGLRAEVPSWQPLAFRGGHSRKILPVHALQQKCGVPRSAEANHNQNHL